jgi:hypothetical protein
MHSWKPVGQASCLSPTWSQPRHQQRQAGCLSYYVGWPKLHRTLPRRKIESRLSRCRSTHWKFDQTLPVKFEFGFVWQKRIFPLRGIQGGEGWAWTPRKPARMTGGDWGHHGNSERNGGGRGRGRRGEGGGCDESRSGVAVALCRRSPYSRARETLNLER